MALSYEAVIADLEARGVMPLQAPDLAPTRQGWGRMRLECDPKRVVVIAGTNGKGSTCATLEALFLSEGRRVGLYTSPHLIDACERIRVDGKDVSRELFVAAWRAAQEKCADLALSHFEMLTLMASWVFFSGELLPRVDYAIFEVGLGGTWDSTNAIPHHFCGIARLGMDHEKLLGNSIESIAANKFGIVGVGASVVHLPFPDRDQKAVGRLARQVAEQTHSSWREARVGHLKVILPALPGQDPQFILESPWGDALLSLPGKRAAENASLALTIFEEMGFNPKKSLRALSSVFWRGRMERVRFADSKCPVYFSGDHNPQGVESLLEMLPYYPSSRWRILVGVGHEKDLSGILEPLFKIPSSRVYLTETPFRGRSIEDYGEWLHRAAGKSRDPVSLLHQVCQEASAEERVLVTGSLYLVGELLKFATRLNA